ncbi:hypothetical protein GDO81_004426 [Engystomops pustulosus]|uniref:Uncharacterized protein n=1 Tax=Engystomops pustulosus TaxID=76066 RepID=A0AAV6ZVX4_ENGPU|nr:hypothetical protein GDO81_004426 [Engystomops pustulosus]
MATTDSTFETSYAYTSTSYADTSTSYPYETSADFNHTDTNKTTAVFSSTSEAVTKNLTTTGNYFNTTIKPETNQGLIIGLSVGIPLAVILIIALAIAIFYFYKKRKTQIRNEGSLHGNETSLYETSINVYENDPTISQNEPEYDTVLRTYNSVYENTLPKLK